jgi:fatty acid desaturase
MEPHARTKRPRGTQLPKDYASGQCLRRFDDTNWIVSVMFAIWYHAQVMLPGYMWIALFQVQPRLSISLMPIVWIWIGSRQRGFENLVHDGSHYNWWRAKKDLNDVLVDALVAAPMALLVAIYRANHMLHHGAFGTDIDPCFRRETMIRAEYARHIPLLRRLIAASQQLVRLNADFYRTQLSSGGIKPLAAFVPWHALVWWLPLTLWFGPYGLGYWVVLWAIPMLITLPVIRALAEADKHDYNRAADELGATFTNDGWIARVVVHPAGDAWHAAHHMRMTVPAWKVRSFHEFMMGASIEYRSQIHETPKFRTAA